MWNYVRLTCVLFALALALAGGGCADDPAPRNHPGDDLLKDPMGYKPQMDDTSSISGGGTMDFDKKGFKKDLHDFLNP